MYQDKTNWDTVYFFKTFICHDALSAYACKDTVIHVNAF